MKLWTTTHILRQAAGTRKSRPIQIRNGIFQGDSLSPLFFSLAVASLSNLLNNTRYGYESQNKKVNLLFFIGDLKTFAN